MAKAALQAQWRSKADEIERLTIIETMKSPNLLIS